METGWSLLTSAATGGVVVVVTAMVCTSGCAGRPIANDTARLAEVRAVEFLKREVPAWSRDNGCFSCHNNGDAARALYTASRQGYRVTSAILADTTRWLAAPAKWDDNKGDPGFSDQRLADIQFAGALLAAFEAGDAVNREAVRSAARRVIAQQAPDGSWPVDAGNAVGSPATYGPALATVMAWRTLQAANTPAARAAQTRADRWLDTVRPNNTVTAAARLWWRPAGNDAALDFLRGAQTSEGGWGPYAATPAEVFDTALAMLALSEQQPRRGVQEMIGRGRAFLAAQQLPDGSWPATTRPPGGASYAQRMSTTGWATLALLATR